MRPSWKANALAGLTIGITLFVGALGAQGGPKQAPKQTLHVTTAPSPKSPSDNTPSSDSRVAPRCHGRLASAGVSFACPSGWFVWENDHFTNDPYQSALIIIANHRPLAQGDDDLPDGWFKADIYVATRDQHLTFDQVARDSCRSPSGTEIVDSCGRSKIGGREWVLAIARDSGYEYRTIATVVNGVEYRAAAYIRLGRTASEGRQEVAALFASFLVG